MKSSDVTEAGRAQIMCALAGHCWDFDFYSDGALLDSTEQESAMI